MSHGSWGLQNLILHDTVWLGLALSLHSKLVCLTGMTVVDSPCGETGVSQYACKSS